MEKKKYKCLVISDFNIQNFVGYLENDTDFPKVQTAVAPYGQVQQVLIKEDNVLWEDEFDFAIIWTQPQSLFESFNLALNYKKVSIDKLLAEVDEFCSLVIKFADKVKYIFLPIWVLPSYHRGLGMLNMRNGVGIKNMLMRMNLRLSESSDKTKNLYMLDTQRWIELSDEDAFNPKLWYMGKIAFGNDVFKESVRDIKTALRGISGFSKKLIILDLDDTLWGGIVGDDGWENLKLGGHNPIGEAFVDFQKELKSLTNRGVILGIVSKNEESTALEAINKHPEMVLKEDDFAGWKINWNDKAQNIVDLVSELNLGLQSTVFIDDNPVERARIRETLPEIFVPDWPEDKMLYAKALLTLACFDSPSVSNEDLMRSKMYIIKRQRDDLKAGVGSIDEWLKTLEIKVKIEELNEANLPRTAQLLNKTNQMNLSTRRMSELELTDWVAQKNNKLWTFRVSDKFGDSGLTGIVSIQIEDKKAKIIDYVLSCRVFGRKVEETMLYIATKYVKSIGLHEIYAEYLPTPKNKPCLNFWMKSGFSYYKPKNTFYWSTINEYPMPKQVQIEIIS
jgi:FkbH-like protein